MLVSDAMRASFATVRPETPVIEAVHLLLETNQRGLPGLGRNELLVGIVSEGDLLHRNELGVSRANGGWLADLLWLAEPDALRSRASGLSVRDCVSDDAQLDEAISQMDARSVAQLPVTCGDGVVGTISRFELVGALGRMLASTSA